MLTETEAGDSKPPPTYGISADAPQFSLGEAFRASMRNLAAGVSVVTVGAGKHRNGFTATSVTSLSVDPPTLLVSVNRSTSSWPLLESTRKFSVNILASPHRDIAETFAGRRNLRGAERYGDPNWQGDALEPPRLVDALAVIECELEEALNRYSHSIVIGRVKKVISNNFRSPLVYWQGKYWDFSGGSSSTY